MTNRRPSWFTFILAIGLTALLVVPLIRGHRPLGLSLLLLIALPPVMALISYKRATGMDRFGRSLYPMLEVSVAILLLGFAGEWALIGEPPWGMMIFLVIAHAIIVLLVFRRNWRNMR